MDSSFTEKLLDWYRDNARELPWRDHPDPYIVWISEVMLQQTRIETVIPYFHRWINELPSISSLASATQQTVLNLWEGLGYYSRARNLHQAAQVIVEKFDGQLPGDVKSLMKLPGIGRYTAAAITSIAFGKNEAALDGNIRRVLSRVFNVKEPIRSSQSEKILWDIAEQNLPKGKAGDYNQALMDLGATICTPKTPACKKCPVSSECLAYRFNIQEERPVRNPSKKTPHHIVTAAVILKKRKILIAQRPQKGLLGGLWEFPGGKQKPNEDLISCLQREISEELGVSVQVGKTLGIYNHAYTHFRVTLHAFLCALNGGKPELKEHDSLYWARVEELDGFPMGKIDRQIANDLKDHILQNHPEQKTT